MLPIVDQKPYCEYGTDTLAHRDCSKSEKPLWPLHPVSSILDNVLKSITDGSLKDT